LGLKQR